MCGGEDCGGDDVSNFKGQGMLCFWEIGTC